VRDARRSGHQERFRTILTAIDAEPGRPIALPGTPKPHPLAGITLDQALDLAIQRLSAVAEKRDAEAKEITTATAEAMQPQRRGPAIPLVPTPRSGPARTRTNPRKR